MTSQPFNPPRILGLDGHPADTRCPRCGAGKEKRVTCATFGGTHDMCGNCGHDFEENTCQE